MWTRSEGVIPLDGDEVQIWKASACAGDAALERYREVLSADESERMNRMRAGVARDEFVVARGLLRMLAGDALGREARSLVFGKGRYGKPEIEGVRFNVSHSHGLILIALCRSAEVGIDLEWVDETIEALDIARQSFSAEEIKRIAGTEVGSERARVFYECWTRKEAIAKAHGAGLLLPLAGFTVPVDSGGGEAVEMMPNAGEAGECFTGGRYFLHDLEIGENFLGSLALNRKDLHSRCFAWSLMS